MREIVFTYHAKADGGGFLLTPDAFNLFEYCEFERLWPSIDAVGLHDGDRIIFTPAKGEFWHPQNHGTARIEIQKATS